MTNSEAATLIRVALHSLRPVRDASIDAPQDSALDEIFDALDYNVGLLDAAAQLLEGRPLEWHHMMAREAAAQGI